VLVAKVVMLESFMPPAIAHVVYANEFSSKPEKIAKVVFGCTLAALAVIPVFLPLAISTCPSGLVPRDSAGTPASWRLREDAEGVLEERTALLAV